MNKTAEYTDKLSRLRDELPFGSINEIAREFHCSPATVRRVLKGKGFRPDIIEAAVKIFEAKKKMMYQIEEAVK